MKSDNIIISIELNGEISVEKLNELLGELDATCSEDSSGQSWADGGYEISFDFEE